MLEQLLNHPGEDIAHVRYFYGDDHTSAGWQAVTYWCTLGGTVLAERANCPIRKSWRQAIADAQALALPVK